LGKQLNHSYLTASINERVKQIRVLQFEEEMTERKTQAAMNSGTAQRR